MIHQVSFVGRAFFERIQIIKRKTAQTRWLGFFWFFIVREYLLAGGTPMADRLPLATQKELISRRHSKLWFSHGDSPLYSKRKQLCRLHTLTQEKRDFGFARLSCGYLRHRVTQGIERCHLHASLISS
jgi:hypothetical protein